MSVACGCTAQECLDTRRHRQAEREVQVLDRAAYLLASDAAPAAAAPLLDILLASAVAGADAAGDIIALPGLMSTVFRLLSSDTAISGQPGCAGADVGALEPPGVRERALELLRRLCQAGPRAAQALHAAGAQLVGHAGSAICHPRMLWSVIACHARMVGARQRNWGAHMSLFILDAHA